MRWAEASGALWPWTTRTKPLSEIVYQTVSLLLILLLLAVIPLTTYAAPSDKDVVVINTTAQPVPTAAQGTTTESANTGLAASALLISGNVRCWGRNMYGQLGNGTYDDVGDDELPSSAALVALPDRDERLLRQPQRPAQPRAVGRGRCRCQR